MTRALLAAIAAMREEDWRHSRAVLRAIADLRAEIRSWGGGASGP